MKVKKLISVLISTTLLMTVAGGCSKSSTSQTPGTTATPSAPVNIDFWGGWTGGDLDTMQALVNKYNAQQTKVHVTFTSLQWTPLFAKFLTEIKGGTPPDILAMHTFEIGQFADMGVLDSNNIAKLKLNKSDYADVAWNGTIYNGKQYAVPLDEDVHGIFYNKDMFAKAGLTDAPKTGDELISMGQKLTIDKNGKHPNEAGFDENNVVQYGLGFAMNHHVFYQTNALLAQEGSTPFTSSMKSVNLDVDKTAKAIGFLEDLVFKYKVVPNGEKSDITDFTSNKVAMIIDGPWQIPTLEGSTVKWASAPYPKVFDKQAVWGAVEVLTFPASQKADASKKQAAADFVNWIEKNSGEWAKSGHIPSSKAGMDVAKTMNGRDAFFSTLGNAVLLPSNPKATQLFSSTAPSPILTAAQDAVLNNKNPKDIATQLKKDLDAILSQQ